MLENSPFYGQNSGLRSHGLLWLYYTPLDQKYIYQYKTAHPGQE